MKIGRAQHDLTRHRDLAGQRMDIEGIGRDVERGGKPAQRLSAIDMETLLGDRIIGNAADRERQQRGEASQCRHAVGAGAAQHGVVGAGGADGGEMAGEQHDRGIAVRIEPGMPAVLDRLFDRVDRGRDGGQRAGIERLLVAECDVEHGGRLRVGSATIALALPSPLPSGRPAVRRQPKARIRLIMPPSAAISTTWLPMSQRIVSFLADAISVRTLAISVCTVAISALR
ncbi:hypothetical protein WR25_26032 [Diploscapter pachys]|uniref:Uncharacterized protein n=1 Tax=Diploscapter pachys TaxID=2018661 RepID=A0A2A2K4L2_9BILA|nr:hypothetical protein WR25_26032 [Diploscapter pachys]